LGQGHYHNSPTIFHFILLTFRAMYSLERVKKMKRMKIINCVLFSN